MRRLIGALLLASAAGNSRHRQTGFAKRLVPAAVASQIVVYLILGSRSYS